MSFVHSLRLMTATKGFKSSHPLAAGKLPGDSGVSTDRRKSQSGRAGRILTHDFLLQESGYGPVNFEVMVC